VVTDPAAPPVDAGGAAFFSLNLHFSSFSFLFFQFRQQKNPAFLSEAGFTENLDVTGYLLPGPPISLMTLCPNVTKDRNRPQPGNEAIMPLVVAWLRCDLGVRMSVLKNWRKVTSQSPFVNNFFIRSVKYFAPYDPKVVGSSLTPLSDGFPRVCAARTTEKVQIVRRLYPFQLAPGHL
jgi:hypothetical protein